MGTHDPLMVDNRYTSDFDTNKYLSSKHSEHQQPSGLLMKDDDGNGSFGRRVYLESPSFGNKEEEDLYRYVPSRLTDQAPSVVGGTFPTHTGGALMDSLDFELDLLGNNNPRSDLPYQQSSKPIVPTRRLSHIPRADPREDPLLGPLLAELDAMSNQQLPSSSSLPNYQPTSVPYQSNLIRPIGLSPSHHVLTNVANRTVNDALLDAELYDSSNRKDQQRLTTTNYSSLNQSRLPNMSDTDLYLPSSTSYTNTHPGSFLNNFGPEDQLFQRPLLNTVGQNYVSNPRLPPPPRETNYEQPQRLPNQPRNNNLNEQTNPFIEHQRPPVPPQNNQEMFFTDHADNPPNQQQDQDSRRQAVWSELQRTNVKVQEKTTKKHESPTRTTKAPFGTNTAWNNSNSQQSSAVSKSPQRSIHQQPLPPIPKSNHIEENIDMIKNKENFYHRYPTKKYENSYAKRKDMQNGNDRHQQESNLPITVNLNTGDNSHTRGSPTTVAIPLDTHINRVGDKISVNIDLRLVDVQNAKQQQGNEPPSWSSGDPLERHIRKLERNIDQSLPLPNPPQRSPPIPSTASNPSISRYGKQTMGAGRGGYNPPVYGGDQYNYHERNREEDSYLAKLNNTRRQPHFKPYTGRDYEQFKKNYGFGTGHLGYDFDNVTHKEKLEKVAKTRQYAQQIESRNRKKIAEQTRRTLSDTRLPYPPRPLEYPLSPIRPKPFSGKTTNSSPAILNGMVPFIPARRPTEVLYRPAPIPEPFNDDIVEHDNVPIIKNMSSPSQKPREQRLSQDRTYQRRLSPSKRLSPIANIKRKPVKFLDESMHRSSQQLNTNQMIDKDQEEKLVMDVIRKELSERPLDPNEELVIVQH